MNELQIFSSETFGQIRTIEEDGQTLFCGVDVAKALGYTNTRDALACHCRYVVKRDVPHPQSPSKTIQMKFITEGDLYRITAASELPAAKEFESWIFDEVLPSLHRTGSYIINTCPKPPECVGEVANYIKVVGKYMEKQGSAPFEIVQMIELVSGQHGIYLPKNVVKSNPYQLTF